MNDNVFCLDAHRRKNTERSIDPSTLTEATLNAERAAPIDYVTWSKDIRLHSEPSLTVRTTAVNVLTDFRIHPVTRIAGHQQVLIALRLDLLKHEELKQVDFMKQSTRLIGRLLGRKVYVVQQDDTLIYTTTHPSPR